MIQRGKLIVLEGLDRSGKSSVSRHLCQCLSAQRPTVSLGFPDRTTHIGRMINDFLSNKAEICPEAVHLLFSANRWESMGKIRAILERGENVVCDRYWYSGVAYSMAKGMEEQWCAWPDKGLLEPDVVVYLKADPESLTKRASYGEQRFQKLQFQRKVKQSFEQLFEKMPQGRVDTVEVGELSLGDVQEQVRQLVQRRLDE